MDIINMIISVLEYIPFVGSFFEFPSIITDFLNPLSWCPHLKNPASALLGTIKKGAFLSTIGYGSDWFGTLEKSFEGISELAGK